MHTDNSYWSKNRLSKMGKPSFWLILFWLIPTGTMAQSALEQVLARQCSGHDFYNDGLFPSQRLTRSPDFIREDNNIFFSALIAYTLQSVREHAPQKNHAAIDSIIAGVKRNYPRYRSRKGEITYNFWQVHPENPMPNAPIFSKMDGFRLPDDLDDTAIIYLTLPGEDSLKRQVKQLMQSQKTSPLTPLKSTLKKYSRSEAYNTWFALNMPQDIDICVMSNAMLFIFESDLYDPSEDLNTLKTIAKMIEANDHLRFPHIISQTYQQTSVILYHVARLVEAANLPLLNQLKPKLINDLNDQLKKCRNQVEKAILLTSLLRLGESPAINIDTSNFAEDTKDFIWFRANFLMGAPVWIKRLQGRNGFLQCDYRSTAYYWTLLFELSCLAKTYNSVSNEVKLPLEQTY